MGSKIEDLIEKIKQANVAIVYGSGENAGGVLSWLVEEDCFSDIEKYVAVTKTSNDATFRGEKVYSIDALTEIKDRAIVLVATYEGYFDEIDKHLDDLGFKNVINIEDWFYYEAYYDKFWKLPIDNKKILVENYCGKGYADNPKYIVEELLKSGKNLDIAWIVEWGSADVFPKGVRTVTKYTREYYEDTATAKIWISNVRKYQSVKKRSGQYYIQTWHGFTLKKIEKDAVTAENGGKPVYFDAAKKDSAMMDLLISNSTFLTDVYSKNFWFDGEILEVGTPRNDFIINHTISDEQEVRKRIGIEPGKKIVMYAPTFRGDSNGDNYDLDIKVLLEVLEKKTNEEWVALIRMHPRVADKAKNFEYSEKIIDATKYTDMMHLLAIADSLVSDYSSSVFDYMYMKRPVLLYAKDLEQYSNHDRGFYLDYNSLPFPIIRNNSEIEQVLNEFNQCSYLEKLELFIKKYGFMDDGKASKRVTDLILGEISG